MNIFPPKMPQDKDSRFGRLHDATGSTVAKYWSIIAAVVISSISVGGIYERLNTIVKNGDETKAQLAQINERQSVTTLNIVKLEAQINTVADANTRNSQSIIELNNKVNLIADKQRWVLK